jgi:xanthine dehydrogenase/oxidase
MGRALFAATNSYKIANVSSRGKVCFTNLPSNTAMRGFGTPQMTVICEAIIEDVAAELGIDAAIVRAKNLFKEGDVTHYGQKLVNCTLQRCWDECEAKSEYATRKQLVQRFNQ